MDDVTIRPAASRVTKTAPASSFTGTVLQGHRQVVGAGPGELTGRGRYWSRAQAAAATPLMSAHTPNARALAARYSLAVTWSRRR